MSPNLYLTCLNDLKTEVPLPPEQKIEVKEVVPPKLTSSSSGSSSESSRENEDGNVAGILLCVYLAILYISVKMCTKIP